jgi:hypothetical protein
MAGRKGKWSVLLNDESSIRQDCGYPEMNKTNLRILVTRLF